MHNQSAEMIGGAVRTRAVIAANAPALPATPVGWHYLCQSGELRPGPVGVTVGGAKVAAFRDAGGRAVALAARCAHMGADLSHGVVVDGRVRCPLHAWEYGGDGRCLRIPVSEEIPPFACQTAYPTAEMGGHVLFYNAPVAEFAMPFFEGVSPGELRAAQPFDFVADAPWYMIGVNGFDVQHFRNAHDRTLVDEPVVDCPAPFARRIRVTFDVTGRSPRDWLTRRLGGPRVRMTVTSWAGTLILAEAASRRTTTRGMVFVRPLDERRCHLRTVVWAPRRRGALAVLDPLDLMIRRWFIRKFMGEDQTPLAGARYNAATLVEADRELREYVDWLARLRA